MFKVICIDKWLPVVGYEGLYEVSDTGLVRSLDAVVNVNLKKGAISRSIKGRELIGWRTHGYKMVSLCKDGVVTSCKVSRLVLSAHLHTAPSDIDCCHNDGDRSNDNLSNLRWDTRKGNMADTLTHGTRPSGIKSGNSTLTEKCVNEIAWLLNEGYSYGQIAKKYSVSKQAISNIKHNKSYVMENRTDIIAPIKITALEYSQSNSGHKFKVNNGSKIYDSIRLLKKSKKCIITRLCGNIEIKRCIYPTTILVILAERQKNRELDSIINIFSYEHSI